VERSKQVSTTPPIAFEVCSNFGLAGITLGQLVLQDDQANQVDSVSYSAAEAAVVDRYIRFQRCLCA
jgi:hypothetical protein